MASRQNISHKEHEHPATPGARAVCRRLMQQGQGPWDGVSRAHEKREQETTLSDTMDNLTPTTRGRKAAATRRKNEALRQQAETVDAVLDATEKRDESGRYMHPTLDEWKSLIEDFETAGEWLQRNATLQSASITMTIGGTTLVATFTPESGWSVGTN